MILTGKAKADFEKWSCNNHNEQGKRLFYIEQEDNYKFINTEHYIHNISESVLYALIIDWFDSVGIRITVSYWDHTDKWQDVVLGLINGRFEHNSRQEATKQAILKANEIYNNN